MILVINMKLLDFKNYNFCQSFWIQFLTFFTLFNFPTFLYWRNKNQNIWKILTFLTTFGKSLIREPLQSDILLWCRIKSFLHFIIAIVEIEVTMMFQPIVRYPFEYSLIWIKDFYLACNRARLVTIIWATIGWIQTFFRERVKSQSLRNRT